MNLCKVVVKYGSLVVFIRHDSAEIWGLDVDSHLALALKIFASTGDFVRVVFALKHSISRFSQTPGMIVT
jgi:hypothetical protein